MGTFVSPAKTIQPIEMRFASELEGSKEPRIDLMDGELLTF